MTIQQTEDDRLCLVDDGDGKDDLLLRRLRLLDRRGRDHDERHHQPSARLADL